MYEFLTKPSKVGDSPSGAQRVGGRPGRGNEPSNLKLKLENSIIFFPDEVTAVLKDQESSTQKSEKNLLSFAHDSEVYKYKDPSEKTMYDRLRIYTEDSLKQTEAVGNLKQKMEEYRKEAAKLVG